MKNERNSGKILIEHYESARKSLITKMKSEDEEQTNLKIKIATFVIYELSHSAHPWFKNHFLSNISKNNDRTDIVNKKVLKVESAFFNVVADYLITMESEIDYVKVILSPLTEWQKKDFWKPIVFDAFLLAGIYFTSLPEFSENDNNRIGVEQAVKMNTHPYFCQMLSEGSAIF